jgi:hypothetical protein
MSRSVRKSSRRDGRQLQGIADLLELAVPEIRKIGLGLNQTSVTRKPKKAKVKS